MKLTHEEFFALAIDPDEAPDPSIVPLIEEHRRACESCREMERDYPLFVELGSRLPTLPPEPPETRARVMAGMREAIAANQRAAAEERQEAAEPVRVPRTRPRASLLRALSFAAVSVVSLGAGMGLDRTPLVGALARAVSRDAESDGRHFVTLGGGDEGLQHVLGSEDVEVALYLEKHGFHDQAKVLAQHALDAGRLAPPEMTAAKAIVRR